jgi:hypothetical protein
MLDKLLRLLGLKQRPPEDWAAVRNWHLPPFNVEKVGTAKEMAEYDANLKRQKAKQ